MRSDYRKLVETLRSSVAALWHVKPKPKHNIACAYYIDSEGNTVYLDTEIKGKTITVLNLPQNETASVIYSYMYKGKNNGWT